MNKIKKIQTRLSENSYEVCHRAPPIPPAPSVALSFRLCLFLSLHSSTLPSFLPPILSIPFPPLSTSGNFNFRQVLNTLSSWAWSPYRFHTHTHTRTPIHTLCCGPLCRCCSLQSQGSVTLSISVDGAPELKVPLSVPAANARFSPSTLPLSIWPQTPLSSLYPEVRYLLFR